MSRRWLAEELNQIYIPAIAQMADTPQGRRQAKQLGQQLREHWAQSRGLVTLMQQQGCMDQTRRAIKEALGQEHWALGVIDFSREEYIELNNVKQQRVAQRNEAVQQLDHPEAIVATAVRLLALPDWADVAAGLAVLTGRRVSELLSTAQFTVKTQWSVWFTGAAKRRGEVGLQFEIPTLTTAERVCAALAKIRRELPQATQMSVGQINGQFEPAVVRSCQRHFQALVPTRQGEDNLYTHLFRAVYATIATFWYCPPAVNEVEFRAAIQGHFQILDEHNPQLRRSLAASRHYADYEISDALISQAQGKRKGIKLGHGGVEGIEMFRAAMTQTSTKPPSGRRTPSSLRVWKEDKHRVGAIFERLGLEGDRKQEDRMRALLDWVEAQLEDDRPTLPRQEVATAERPIATNEAEGVAATGPEPHQPEGEAQIEAPLQSEQGQSEPRVDPLRSDLQELTATLKQLLPLWAQGGERPPVEKRASSPPAAPPPSSTPHARRNSTKPLTIQRTHQAIEAILAYNNAPDRRHDDKWAITINALKDLGLLSVPTVEAVLQERADEIQHHYAQHQIDPAKHNYKHRGKTKISQLISIEPSG